MKYAKNIFVLIFGLFHHISDYPWSTFIKRLQFLR